MKVFSALTLLLTLDTLHEYRETCDKSDPGISVDPRMLDGIKDWFLQAEELFYEIGLYNAKVKINAIRAHITMHPEAIDHSSLSADLRNIHDMIVNDMWQRQFVQIPAAYSGFANKKDLFGKRVSRAFPGAILDIQEAGNCISIDSGTAAVFHLMRAVEWSLRALCHHLGIRSIPNTRKPKKKKRYIPLEYNMWEKILEEANLKIDAKISKMLPGNKKQEAQQFYYPLLRDYRGFKDAWRNHCMHTRDEYSAKSAAAICEHVKTFMVAMAKKISK